MTTPLKPFYILWSPDAAVPPKVRFKTEQAATNIAEKMARKYGKQFYVFESKAKAQAVTAVRKYSFKKNVDVPDTDGPGIRSIDI